MQPTTNLDASHLPLGVYLLTVGSAGAVISRAIAPGEYSLLVEDNSVTIQECKGIMAVMQEKSRKTRNRLRRERRKKP